MSADKKTQIYDAVLQLINERRNISSIKVSEIAERANIGKGTVYEYFDSKEQLIAQAIAYTARNRVLSMENLINMEASFKNTFLAILKDLGEEMKNNMTLFGHMSVNEASFSMHKAIQRALEAQIDEMHITQMNMIEKLVEKGIEEKVLKRMPPRYRLLIAFNSATMCLFLYKKGLKEFEGLAEQDTLFLAYDIFVKLLE